jgi:hypothetical protein
VHPRSTHGTVLGAILESVDAATMASEKALPCLRSCAYQASAAWLTALPMAPALELKDVEHHAAMQPQLGMSPLPCNAVDIRCQVVVPSVDGSDHAMTCTFVQGKPATRHDILKGILHRAVHSAKFAFALEPTLLRLLGLEAGAYCGVRETGAPGMEARGDILRALESGMSVVDVSTMHPSGVANRAAAATMDGAAAAQWDREKRRTYGQLEPTRYPFIPF